MDCYLTMVAKWTVRDRKIQSVSYLPAYLPEDGAPYVLKPEDELFSNVAGYVERITKDQGFGTIFTVKDGEVFPESGEE